MTDRLTSFAVENMCTDVAKEIYFLFRGSSLR